METRERYGQAGKWRYDQRDADEGTPLLPKTGQPVPLTNENSYEKARGGFVDRSIKRSGQLLTVASAGVFSASRSLGRLVATSWQRDNAHDELKAVEQALDNAGFPKRSSAGHWVRVRHVASQGQVDVIYTCRTGGLRGGD